MQGSAKPLIMAKRDLESACSVTLVVIYIDYRLEDLFFIIFTYYFYYIILLDLTFIYS